MERMSVEDKAMLLQGIAVGDTGQVRALEALRGFGGMDIRNEEKEEIAAGGETPLHAALDKLRSEFGTEGTDSYQGPLLPVLTDN